MNLSEEDAGEVPPGVTTVILTVPADPAGDTAVISVDESTVKLVASMEPKSTYPAPERFSPVIVTLVPPEVGPVVGEMEETTGAGGTNGLTGVADTSLEGDELPAAFTASTVK